MSVNLKKVLSPKAYDIVKNYALTGQDAISLLGYKNKDSARVSDIVSTFSALANPKYLNAIREDYGNEFYNTPYEPREDVATYLNDKYNAFALKGRDFQTTKIKFPLVGDYKVENKRFLESSPRYNEIVQAFESGFNVKIQEKIAANELVTARQGFVRSFIQKSTGIIKAAGRAIGKKLKPAKYNAVNLSNISLVSGKGIGKTKLRLANGNAKLSGYTPINLPISQGDKIVSLVDYFSGQAMKKLYKQNKHQTYLHLTPDSKKYMFASQLLADIFICQGLDMGGELNAKVDHALKLQLSNLLATMSDKESDLMPIIASNAEKVARVVLHHLGVSPAEYVQIRKNNGISYNITPKNYYELFFGATTNDSLIMMDASTEKDAEKIVLYTDEAKIFEDYKLEEFALNADDIIVKPGPMRTFTDALLRQPEINQEAQKEELFEDSSAEEQPKFVTIDDIEKKAALGDVLEQPAEKAFEFVDEEETQENNEESQELEEQNTDGAVEENNPVEDAESIVNDDEIECFVIEQQEAPTETVAEINKDEVVADIQGEEVEAQETSVVEESAEQDSQLEQEEVNITEEDVQQIESDIPDSEIINEEENINSQGEATQDLDSIPEKDGENLEDKYLRILVEEEKDLESKYLRIIVDDEIPQTEDVTEEIIEENQETEVIPVESTVAEEEPIVEEEVVTEEESVAEEVEENVITEENSAVEENEINKENQVVDTVVAEPVSTPKITTKRELTRRKPRKFVNKREITVRKANPAHILMGKEQDETAEFLRRFVDTHTIVKTDDSEVQSKLTDFESKNHTLNEYFNTERLSDGILNENNHTENTVILLPSAERPLLTSGEVIENEDNQKIQEDNQEEVKQEENQEAVSQEEVSQEAFTNEPTAKRATYYDKSVITRKQAEKAFDTMIKNAVKEVHGFYVKKLLEKPNADLEKELNTVDFMQATLDGVKFNIDNPTREMVEGEVLLEKLNYIKENILDDVFKDQDKIQKDDLGVASASSLINKYSKQQHNNSYMKTVLKKFVVKKIAYNKARENQAEQQIL